MKPQKQNEKPVNEPVLTSATMYKIPGDDFAWRAVEIQTQGPNVISRKDICTPNIRAIIEERLKIFIAKNIFGK